MPASERSPFDDMLGAVAMHSGSFFGGLGRCVVGGVGADVGEVVGAVGADVELVGASVGADVGEVVCFT